ncbi:MAG TPA: hypothetical protein VLM37_01600 [Fibrobacteraceae bacterium]|nr:hypothetical protein [Fibrobacteraceae bacterium]
MIFETVLNSPLICTIITAIVAPIFLLIIGQKISTKEIWSRKKLPPDDQLNDLFPKGSSAEYAIRNYKERLAFKAVYGFDFLGGKEILDKVVAFHQSGHSSYTLRSVLDAFKDVTQYEVWLQKTKSQGLRTKIDSCFLRAATGFLFLVSGACAVLTIICLWIFWTNLGAHWVQIVQLLFLMIFSFAGAIWYMRENRPYLVQKEYLKWLSEKATP